MRASTDGLGSNLPTLLFSRNGAVDHGLTKRRHARVAAAAGRHLYGSGSPVNGS